MWLKDGDLAIFKCSRIKLISVADPMGLLPFLTSVFDDTDISTIYNKNKKFGRNYGMLELLSLYERKARDLNPLKKALSHCNINAEELFSSTNDDKQAPHSATELVEAMQKLQAIEQRVTYLASELHTQIDVVQRKLSQQTATQSTLQSELFQVQESCQETLSNFETKLSHHQSKHRELNGKLRIVEKELQDEMTKIQEDQAVQTSHLYQSLRETIKKYQQLQSNITQINMKVEQDTSDLGVEVNSQLLVQSKLQSQVEKLGVGLKHQENLQKELACKMREVDENLVDVNKVVDDKIQQQIVALHSELNDTKRSIEKDRESKRIDKQMTKAQIAEVANQANSAVSKLERKISVDMENVNRTPEIVNLVQTQMASDQLILKNTATKTDELLTQMDEAGQQYRLQIEVTEKQLEEMKLGFEEFQSKYHTSRDQDEKVVQDLRKNVLERDNDVQNVQIQANQFEAKTSKIIDDFESFWRIFNSEIEKLQPRQSNTSILLIGGETKIGGRAVPLISLEIYNPYNQSFKSLVDCQLKIGRSCHLAAKLGNKVYIAGGFDLRNAAFPTVEVFDLFLHSIAEGPRMLCPRVAASAVTLDGRRLAVFGGKDDKDKPLSTCELFDSHTNVWSPYLEMMHTRYDHTAAQLDGKVYVIGGCLDGNDQSRISSSVSSLDIVSRTWIDVNQMKHKRANAGAETLDGCIVVTGGWYGRMNGMKSCEQYDPREGKWIEITDMQQKRIGHSLVSINDKLLSIGGYDETAGVAEYLDTVEEYDTRANKWQMVETTLREPKGYMVAMVL